MYSTLAIRVLMPTLNEELNDIHILTDQRTLGNPHAFGDRTNILPAIPLS